MLDMTCRTQCQNLPLRDCFEVEHQHQFQHTASVFFSATYVCLTGALSGLQEVLLEERQLPTALEVSAAPGPDKPLPLRLLNNFSIYRGDVLGADYISLNDLPTGSR